MDPVQRAGLGRGSLALCRFHATRQRAEQNRACSRCGANDVPHQNVPLPITATTWTANLDREPGST
jgi:hypothetical protein